MDGSYDDFAFGAHVGIPAQETFSHMNWEEWLRWDPSAAAGSPKTHHSLPPRSAGTPAEANGRLSRNNNVSTPPHTMQAFTFSPPLDEKNPFAYDGNGMIIAHHILPPATDSQAHHGLFSPFEHEQHHHFTMVPPPQSTPSLHHSPESSTDMKTTPSSQSSPTSQSPPNTADSHSRKRKSSASGMSSDRPDKDDKLPPPKKTAHNMIEKRYRNNLNEKIRELRMAVPSLRAMTRANGCTADEDDAEDLEGLTPAHKLNKATVLSKATEYIHHLEKRVKQMQDEMNLLKSRLDTIDKYSMTGTMPMAMASAVGTPTCRVQEDPFTTAAIVGPVVATTAPQGMIPVPQSMVNLHRNAYHHHNRPDVAGGPAFSSYAIGAVRPSGVGDAAQIIPGQGHPNRALQGYPMVNHNGGGNGFMNKLIVGSLAGLMLLEGFHEHEQSSESPSGRGLFAAPFHFLFKLGPKLPSDVSIHNASVFQRAMPLLKSFVIITAIVYNLLPYLTFKAQPKKRPAPLFRLAPAPSLASPIEVRRTAWLTAIQTVWVPQHSFVLEAAALALKILKLSTRKLIGWQGYAFLTGITKEQEAARIKAWEIALNAQLTGGDAEISASRLMLTLMASGTLPDTPARLMLKALHICVLFCDSVVGGYSSSLFDGLWLKLARSYWNAAQDEYRVTSFGRRNDHSHDDMPKHLVALLQLECDDVLIRNIVQRAYTLAWNRPSTEMSRQDEAMDAVVEDSAISSPLDALAAWWSTHMLTSALVDYLGEASNQQESTGRTDVLSWGSKLQLAIDTAPRLTGAWTRALVAKAFLNDGSRGTNISHAFEALPTRTSLCSAPHTPNSSPRAVLMNIIDQTPVGPDVQIALTLAKCLALANASDQGAADEARASAVHVVDNFVIPEAAFSVLSVVAAYKLINTFADDEQLFARSKHGLERITTSIRTWIGGDGGRSCGINSQTRGRIIGRCLAISRKLVGIQQDNEAEIDAGYHTQSDVDPAFA